MPFGVAKFLLNDFGLDLQVGQLISKALVVDPKLLSLLLSTPDFLVHEDPALYSHVVLGLHVLQGRGSVPGLSLVVIVCDFNIPQFELHSTVRFSQGSNLLLQIVLRGIAFRLRLLVFGLPAQC